MLKIPQRISVNVDYDTYYDCEGQGCDSICRCSTITNTRIEESIYNRFDFAGDCGILENNYINIENVLDFLYIKNLVKTDFFDIRVCGGYYGDELDKTVFTADHLINEFNSLSIKDKLEKCLSSDYGKVLPDIESVTGWELKYVPVDMIRVTNTNVSSTLVEDYKTHAESAFLPKNFKELIKLYAPIVLPRNNKYSIIDGNHKFSSIANKVLKHESYVYRKNKHGKKSFTTTKPITDCWVICPT